MLQTLQPTVYIGNEEIQQVWMLQRKRTQVITTCTSFNKKNVNQMERFIGWGRKDYTGPEQTRKGNSKVC